jgi:hypothetical protein
VARGLLKKVDRAISHRATSKVARMITQAEVKIQMAVMTRVVALGTLRTVKKTQAITRLIRKIPSKVTQKVDQRVRKAKMKVIPKTRMATLQAKVVNKEVIPTHR